MLCLFFSAYIMTGYRDDITLFPLLCMSLFLLTSSIKISLSSMPCLFFSDRRYMDDIKHTSPLLCYDTGMILITSSLFYAMSLFSAYIMTGYRDDINHTSLFYAMSLFSAYIMTGYRDDINHTLPSSSVSFSHLHYDRIQGCLFFYAMSLFSAYIMTGYRDDINHTLPLFYAMSLFSAYIMTGYRDDIKHTLPSSMLCLFSLLTL
ncbi:unnamed protein product [Acanthosepion pharaonis]|uniref:Uncharacterized protein n=1 Tax=Acanthosepion pharaonis TaxID=158019 RepID=A0A812AZS4_ACAPH|nr:unnamed protein product [Sepia pharaonis]